MEETICRECGGGFRPRGLTTRYCPPCASARRRERIRKRDERKRRTVSRPKIKGWVKRRSKAAESKLCRVCLVVFAKGHSPAIDHIIPAAVVDSFKNPKFDAEDERNLLAACGSCHGKKRKAEIKLERGDVLGYLSELNRLGYPMDRVKKAMKLYGMEMVKEER